MNTLVEGPFFASLCSVFHALSLYFFIFKMHSTASDDAKCSLLGMYPSSCFIGFRSHLLWWITIQKTLPLFLIQSPRFTRAKPGPWKAWCLPTSHVLGPETVSPHRGCLSNNHNDHIRKPGVWPKAQLLQLAYHVCTQHYNKAVIPGKAIMT